MIDIVCLPHPHVSVTWDHLKRICLLLRCHQKVNSSQILHFCYCYLVTKSCLGLCDLMDCRKPGFPVLHYLPELAQLMSIESVILSNQFSLCRSPLLLPSIFPSFRIFCKELALCIR